MSPINARVAIQRARRLLRDPNVVAADEWAAFVHAVRVSAAVFVPPDAVQAMVASLQERGPNGARELAARTLPVRSEDDLRLARLVAREMCQTLGASSVVVQRVATAVSELTRNIISYTPGGTLVLTPVAGPPARIRIVAEDRGRGIPNLTEILEGRYRSKTGLGRGLLGVRQLMAGFDVKTGPDGTRITAEATLQ